MGITYFKRYRMEINLNLGWFSPPPLPLDYRLVPWDDDLLDAHAEAKHQSFCFELDANLFPCLGEREGCQRLMAEITQRDLFVRGATWLLQYQGAGLGGFENCGTIQGIRDRGGLGSVQNIGVTPRHRGRGLGTQLVYQSLCGFWEAGVERVSLEVTAQNLGAIRLYQRLGFRRVKTVYKAAEVAFA